MMSTAETVLRITIADPYTRFCWGYLSQHPASVRELHEASGAEDWWPIKAGLETLKRMRLIDLTDVGASLTEFGKRVRDVQAATRELKAV